MRENMPPEDQLCLLLARGQLAPGERARALEFLAAQLQWPLILERAYSHQVYPLLYRNLLDLGFPGVPESVQAEVKSLFLANAFRNQLLADELARLLGLLGEAGIRVVPLKGVALAQALYGDTAARGMRRYRHSGSAGRPGPGHRADSELPAIVPSPVIRTFRNSRCATAGITTSCAKAMGFRF